MRTLLAISVFLTAAASAFADSVIYLTSDEMIRDSTFIAVVDVDKSESGKFSGKFTYPHAKDSQKTTFFRRMKVRTIDAIKGSPPKEFFIHDQSGRWDVMFQRGPGRYLVFIRGDEPFYTGVNGWFSSRPVKDDQVEWARGAFPSEFKHIPLRPLLARIKESTDAR